MKLVRPNCDKGNTKNERAKRRADWRGWSVGTSLTDMLVMQWVDSMEK